jgi:hypothetical protein
LYFPKDPDGFACDQITSGPVQWSTGQPPSSADAADSLLAHDVRAEFAGRPLRSYRPPKRRWGSVTGIQPDGLEVFAPNGRAFTFPAWSFDRVLMPLIVRWGIYRGVRDNRPL